MQNEEITIWFDLASTLRLKPIEREPLLSTWDNDEAFYQTNEVPKEGEYVMFNISVYLVMLPGMMIVLRGRTSTPWVGY